MIKNQNSPAKNAGKVLINLSGILAALTITFGG